MDFLKTMPPALKVVAAVLAGASLMAIIGMIFGMPMMFYIIVGAGILLVVLLLFLFKLFLDWRKKRRSAPLEQGISGNAAAAPQGISEPARRARLDDLRRNFETGVSKFRAAGKNLYSVPWYVVVGEPGSGKTEAIRHCNVGFPPGLQDQLQGAGGTLNMNWWFTNHAIILDTAGRLMFEEVVPGSTNEWQEFLKLLNSNRPSCPINGMLLVIPVDTLIKDTADSIEKKASKIAQQFDSIQRALGVRFPVFVIITKCDLLNGFREFFDDLNDPQLQHQIMGWSNPNPLDTAFNPEQVDKHLQVVRKRLTDRRGRLLQDPVHTEDPNGRRIEQVDALFALPESITKIGPRLRLYLEKIFVSGEWSPKPLFLRGIYFTSSMTEGSALDADLAEVLGLPVDALPEGRIWQRDRAFFLRDLFLQKVFREKGLVTRAGNAAKQQRNRKLAVLIAGFAAVLILFALTLWGASSLRSSIVPHRNFWKAASEISPESARLVVLKAGKPEYKGTEGMDIVGRKTTVAQFYGANLDLVRAEISVPLVFRPVAVFQGNVNKERRTAYCTLFDQTIIDPLVNISRTRLAATTADNWNDDATGTLLQLLRIELGRLKQPLPSGEPPMDLDPMLRFTLSPEDYKVASADKASLQDALNWIYGPGGGVWPPSGTTPDPSKKEQIEANADLLKTSLDRCLTYWNHQIGDQNPYLSALVSFKNALTQYQAAEDDLLKLKGKVPDKMETYQAFLGEWKSRLGRVTAARNQAAEAWATAAKLRGNIPAEATLSKLYTDELTRVQNNARRTYDALLKVMPEALAKSTESTAQILTSARSSVLAASDNLDKWKATASIDGPLGKQLDNIDHLYVNRIKGMTDGDPAPRYEVALAIYAAADARLPRDAATQPAPAFGSIATTLRKVGDDIGSVRTGIEKVSGRVTPEDRLAQAAGVGNFALDTALYAQRYYTINTALARTPASAEAWGDFVTAHAAGKFARPEVPLLAVDPVFPAMYDPTVAGSLADDVAQIDAATAKGEVLEKDAIVAKFAADRHTLDSYLAKYVNYWVNYGARDNLDEFHFAGKDWKDFAGRLELTKDSAISAGLADLGAKIQLALDRVKSVAPAAASADIKSAIDALDRAALRDDVRNVLGHWKDLGSDARAARRNILGRTPSRFRDDFMVGNTKPTDGYVARFWQAFTVEALRILASDGQAEVRAGLDDLTTKYNHFPLAPLGDGKQVLSEADLKDARAAFQRIVGNFDIVAAAPGQEALGQGASTHDKDIDNQIERLRGINLLVGKEQYIERCKAVLKALPESPKTALCAISIVREKLKADNSASDPYPYMDILAGNKSVGTANLRSMEAEKIDKVEFPGPAISFAFRKTQDAKVDQTLVVDGPWSPIRLLHQFAAKRDARDAHKWTLEMPVKDAAGKTWSVWLQLEFEQDFPELSDWPATK